MTNAEDMMQIDQKTASAEEMEVKIDPMLFLQCALDQSPSEENSDFSEDSDKEVDPQFNGISFTHE